MGYNNAAKALYQKALGAEEIIVIKDLYSADEATLIAVKYKIKFDRRLFNHIYRKIHENKRIIN